MTVLITGSIGKTASHLASLLAPTHPILIASRRPKPDALHPAVRFDWLDTATYDLPFTHLVAKQDAINAIYLVSPDVPEARGKVIEFVRYAATREKGVKRFILLSAWENGEGGAFMGETHAALKAMQSEEGIEWAVLRPHFFMENFIEGYHRESIRKEGKIYTAAGEGRKPFIAARDIANVARVALTCEKPVNDELLITGPESLTYTQVADTLSEVLGKEVEHISLRKEGFRRKLLDEGFTTDMAEYMAELDVRVSEGEGEQVTDVVEKVTGEVPMKFRDFVEQHRHVWM